MTPATAIFTTPEITAHAAFTIPEISIPRGPGCRGHGAPADLDQIDDQGDGRAGRCR